MIEKRIGRTPAGAPKKSRETTFGAAEEVTLALTVGLAAFCGTGVLWNRNASHDSDHIET